MFKAGELIVEQGEIRRDTRGQTLYVEAPWDAAILPTIEKWFSDFYTIQLENYPVDMAYLSPRGSRPPTTR